MIKADVIIVGGGPAGSVCAKKLTDKGVSVIIMEEAELPLDKPCAGWITPEVMEVLHPLFPDYPRSLTRFLTFSVSVRGCSFRMRVNQYAVRRIEFDNWLLTQCGARVLRHRVRTVEYTPSGYIIDNRYAGSFIVGAGGTSCPVYRCLFRDREDRGKDHLVIAMTEEFQYPHEESVCRLWFFHNRLPGYSWFVPKKQNIINIGVGAKALSLRNRNDSLKRHWSLLTEMMEETGLVTGRIFRPSAHSYYIRRERTAVQDKQAYLIGDSAGLATRDMGEGLGPAVQSGLLAAQAILDGQDYSIDDIRKYSFPSMVFGRNRTSFFS